MSDEILDAHNLAVQALYDSMRPLIEGAETPVVMNVMMILLAMMGKQTNMAPEQFKAFVVMELDRLMSIVEVDDE